MGNFNLNLVCLVVRPVASNVPVGGEIVLFECLRYLPSTRATSNGFESFFLVISARFKQEKCL